VPAGIRAVDATTPAAIQIALAESAAPPVGADAAIFTIGPKGYTKARDGRNGFTCLISRQHRDMLEPECFDAEGTATVVFRFAVCSSRFAVWFASQFRSLQFAVRGSRFAVRSLVRGSRFRFAGRRRASHPKPRGSHLEPRVSRLASRPVCSVTVRGRSVPNGTDASSASKRPVDRHAGRWQPRDLRRRGHAGVELGNGWQ
jgi:hypothetical protein